MNVTYVPGVLSPNDTNYTTKYGLNNTGQSGGTADADVDAPEAWSINNNCKQANLKIAVIREGFGHDNSDPRVDDLARKAADQFIALGATVEEVSLPIHRQTAAIWTPTVQ